MQPKLHVLICSTRPGRVGPAIAHWFRAAANAHGKFAVELVDLQDFALPVFDEPRHPRLQQYEHAHTRRWSASVAGADAFVFVTPEYNYTLPPSLLNALNFLSREWTYKPVASSATAASVRGCAPCRWPSRWSPRCAAGA